MCNTIDCFVSEPGRACASLQPFAAIKQVEIKAVAPCWLGMDSTPALSVICGCVSRVGWTRVGVSIHVWSQQACPHSATQSTAYLLPLRCGWYCS
jgi:hypothetical protein